MLATLRAVATVLIWLGAFAPVWLAALVVGWVIQRRVRAASAAE